MALPNPGMTFTPFDILTAEEMNNLVENIESLATGTALDDSSVTTNKIANANVTSAKLATNFLKGRFQANTTNSDVSGLTIQQGWGFLSGSGTQASGEAVTLPTAFTSTNYLVFVTPLGFKIGSDPSSQADVSAAPSIHGNANIASASSFNVYLFDVSTSMGTTTRFAYSWLAIGTV